MTPVLNQVTSAGVWGMTPAEARISGAMQPAAPSMAHREWITSLYLQHRNIDSTRKLP